MRPDALYVGHNEPSSPTGGTCSFEYFGIELNLIEFFCFIYSVQVCLSQDVRAQGKKKFSFCFFFWKEKKKFAYFQLINLSGRNEWWNVVTRGRETKTLLTLIISRIQMRGSWLYLRAARDL